MASINFLDALASSFSKLPGVGKKTATRYAYSVIEKLSDDEVTTFANALLDTKKSIKKCSKCGMLSISSICELCSDKTRDLSKIMILKDTKDILAVESIGEYNGLYHCLNGLISPLDGIGPDLLNIDSLEPRLSDCDNIELIIATPFTQSGETTALFLEKLFNKYHNVTISRLGFGLPAGGELEYVDELTLRRAISLRTINKK